MCSFNGIFFKTNSLCGPILVKKWKSNVTGIVLVYIVIIACEMFNNINLFLSFVFVTCPPQTSTRRWTPRKLHYLAQCLGFLALHRLPHLLLWRQGQKYGHSSGLSHGMINRSQQKQNVATTIVSVNSIARLVQQVVCGCIWSRIMALIVITTHPDHSQIKVVLFRWVTIVLFKLQIRNKFLADVLVQMNILSSSALSITTFQDACLQIALLIITIHLYWWRSLLLGSLCFHSALVLFKFQLTQFEEMSLAFSQTILKSSNQSFVMFLATSILRKIFGRHWTMNPTLPSLHTGLTVIGN